MRHELKELEAERGEPKEPEAVDDELGTEQAAEEASGEKVEAADGEDASAKRCRLLQLYRAKINDLKSQEVAQRSAHPESLRRDRPLDFEVAKCSWH